jgi:hypothetical protein
MLKGCRVTKRHNCRDVTAAHHFHQRGMGQHAGRHRTGEFGGCAESGNCTTIGSDTTQWRNGTTGLTWSTRSGAVCDIRPDPPEGRTTGACS